MTSQNDAIVWRADAEDGGSVWVHANGEWGHKGGSLNWALDVLATYVAKAHADAARGGALAADAFSEVEGRFIAGEATNEDTGTILQHAQAQGARIAALEQHISELETSLENVRKERDEAQSEFDRLKPSGQVAEDVEQIRFVLATHLLQIGSATTDALSRLAAKAQGYEAAVADLERYRADDDANTAAIVAADMAPMNTAEAIAVLAKERAAAVADNAALLHAWNEAWEHNNFRPGENLAQPHPGAALLERMKSLEDSERKASCDVLERVAVLADTRAIGVGSDEATALRWIAREIRLMKTLPDH